jgi:acyl-coenzyme A synthetase/AMP-(fatty) acid ligase
VQRVPLVERAPDAVLFCMPGRVVTAGRFAADALRLAATLPDSGHAVNLCRGRYTFTVAFAAALLRGHPSLLTSDRSPGRLDALAARFPGSYTVGDEPGAQIQAGPPGDATAPIPSVPSDRLAAYVFTSGSTGEPVAHTKFWGALAERSRAATIAFAVDPQNPATIVATVPPQHMYGFETTVLWPLHGPVASWCGPVFYPADTRAALDVIPGPRLLVTTPMQLRGLLESAPPLPPLAAIISATALLDPDMAAAAEQRWATETREIFGATEVGSIAVRRTVAGEAWTPYPGIGLVQTESGLQITAPGAAATALDDAIEILPGGGFRLLGRRTDLVKLGGRRASLAGLNRILAAIEGVLDGVFIPPTGPEHHATARMTAIVVAPGLAPGAILADLRSRIDPVFLPRRIVLVDRLPRNEMGKLQHAALAALQAAS